MNKPKENQQDPLTGLYSRSTFSSLLASAIESAESQSQALAVALIDIDHFLLINKNNGHEGGDAVLKELAARILNTLGGRDMAVRYGGDEFAIIFTDTEREQALLTLEGLRTRFEREPVQQGGKQPIKVEISAGVAAYPIDGSNEAELVRKADQALYRAKVLGRNRVRLAYEEKMAPKTSHYTITQLERLSKLSQKEGVGEAELLREALDDLLRKYGVNPIES